MGIYDSSKTRVEPVFKRLIELDSKGAWLSRLLGLPGRDGVTGRLLPDPGVLCEYAWYPQEKRLAPPMRLLEHLVETLRFKEVAENEPELRLKLLTGDVQASEAARRLLRAKTRERWHIFEGETSADVFLATKTLIVVIEGKRTEPGPTTRTKWMAVRHQMLRNIDAAWEIRGNRDVVGFFIVEGTGDSAEIPSKWREFVRETVSEKALTESLPHRDADERLEIGDAFLGVTTWQRVCAEFGIPWAEIKDLVAD